MKKYIYIIIWLLSPILLQAQNTIVQAEYWFDGQYSTVVTQNVGPETDFTLNEMIDVSALIDGLHTVTYRFKDQRGIWGSVLTKFFTYSPISGTYGVHDIIEAEFWYDADFTTATKVSIGPGNTLQVSELLDVASLNYGLHTLTYRFKDDRNIWGAPLTKFFSKNQGTGLHEIVKLEYWYDNDFTNVIRDDVTATTSFDINQNLDISTLSIGIHTVNYRFQDDAGKWSPVRSWLFHNVPQQGTIEMHAIVAIEYWYDGDYSGVQTETVSTTEKLDLDKTLNITSLDFGLHYITYRFKDESGEWSSAVSKFFSYNEEQQSAELHQIKAMEYWFDGDITTSTNEPISTSNNFVLDQNFDVTGLDYGLHFISYRFQDEAGEWSSAVSKLFSHYPEAEATAMRQITAYEYWFDGDLTSITTQTIGETNLFSLNETLDVKSLNQGLHIISYRFKDKTGEWSSAKSKFFSYSETETLAANNRIIGYRYWSDAAIENAYEVTLATPLNTVIIDELTDISNFPGGEHQANFQFVDSNGNWSGTVSQTISKPVQPFVEIAADDSTVCFGSSIAFSSDVNDADEITWKFGDGTTSSDFMPEHTYLEAGNYEVTAIVTHTDSAKSAYDTLVGGITVYPAQNIWLGDIDTIFLSSFENDVVNAAPADWILRYNGTGTANQIVVNSPVKNGTKAFQMEGSGWASEFYRRPSTMPDEVTLETWVNCEKILSGLAGSIGVGNFNVGTWGTRTSRLQFNAGKISATYSSGPTYEIMDYTPGQWYHIKMIHDLINRTYQVYINNVLVSGTNGVETTSDFPMHPSVETIDVMLAAGNSGTNKMIFDDIVLSQKGNLEICENDLPYQLGSQQISSEGFYSETFTNSYGCDSIVSLNLKIYPTYQVELDSAVICQGENYLLGTELLTTSGTYQDTLQTVNGCDSILVLKLTVNATYEIPLDTNICAGNSYAFAGKLLTETGTYLDTLQTINNCDSVLVLILTVNPIPELTIDSSICEGEDYAFAEILLTESGTYRDTLQTDSNCDSILVLNLTVNQVYETLIDSVICDGESVSFAGELQTTTGIYKDTLQSVSLCDSIIILDLQVHPIYNKTASKTICEGDSYQFGDSTMTSSETYTYTFESVSGCDSTVTLALTVTQTIRESLNATICSGDSFYFRNTDLSIAGVYKDTLISASGCDSIVTLNLTMNEVYETAIEASICEGDNYSFAGELRTSEGIYKDTLQSVNNCDSILVLNLKVNPVYETLVEVEICDGEHYSFAGQQVNTGGIYKDTLKSVSNCDSVIVLSLAVNPVYDVKVNDTICEGDTYLLGNQSLTTEGIYSHTFETLKGCDSVVMLTLTVNPTYNIALNEEICQGDEFIFGNNTLSASGVYEQKLATTSGCDSILTLTLTVHPTYNIYLKVNIDENEFPYIFGSTLIDTAGLYRDTFATINGCDSIVQLYLNIADEVPPLVQCNAIAVSLKTNGRYELSSDDLKDLAAGTTDNVSDTDDLEIKVTPSVFTCNDVGQVAVTVTVVDEGGNQASCATSVYVYNNYKIQATEVPDIEIILNDGSCETQIDYPHIGALGPCVSFNQIEGLGSDGIFPVGNTTETWVASNTSGKTDTLSFTVSIISENKVPTINPLVDVETNEDTPITIELSGISNGGDCDEKGVTLTISDYNSNLINYVVINFSSEESSGTLEIIPAANAFGTASFSIIVEDSYGSTKTESFELNIKPINDAPVIVGTIPDQDVRANEILDFSLSKILGVLFDDVDNDSLSYSVLFENGMLPGWIIATENPDLFNLNFAPLRADTGCYNIVVSAIDTGNLSVSDTFEFCVSDLLVGITTLNNGLFELNLYPNPTKGPVTVDIETFEQAKVEIRIINIAGSEILRKRYNTSDPVFFNLSGEVSGIYMAIITLDNKRVIKKIILDRE